MKGKATCLSLFLLFAVLPAVFYAQDAGSKTSASPKSNDSSDPTGGKAQGSAPAEKKKPKKVWTNEEIGSVTGDISVVGEANQSGNVPLARKSDSSTGGNEYRQKQIESYRKQIRDLQAQINAADKRIGQLKSFKGENTAPAEGINPNQGYNMVPVEEQVKQQEGKKKKLQGKIDELENEARKNGIDPGELR